MSSQPETTARPAFVPPDAVNPQTRCYICGGSLGVLMWHDQHGTAHTSCVPSERPKWEREAMPVECDLCGWKGRRKIARSAPCPNCGSGKVQYRD